LAARLLWEQKVVGSSPTAPTKPDFSGVSGDIPRPPAGRKADALLGEAIEAFLLSRRVGNCSAQTLDIYAANLERFRRSAGDTSVAEISALAVQRYLIGLRTSMKPVSVHQHFRTLRTFFRWTHEAGLTAGDLMRGIAMRLPRLMPRVPEDDEVQRLLQACGDSFEGRRNKALVSLLADSGLRISEALGLRVEDVRFGERTLAVRGGKGQKDGMGFFGAETSQALRAWLESRRNVAPEDFLFVERLGRPLTRDWGTHLLHKLSARAGLARKIGPHALRHYAATSILKQTGDLELVRQVPRHESRTMALRYAHIAKPEISQKFRRASPLDNLRAGR
jgi:site-specific recombinase XerD